MLECRSSQMEMEVTNEHEKIGNKVREAAVHSELVEHLADNPEYKINR